MEVHRLLGPGYLESIYHEAMGLELQDRGISWRREVPFSISYKGRILGHPYRADLVCDNGVLVDLKAHAGFNQADEAQIIHYLRASKLSTGLLINFGLPSLQQRRFVLGTAWSEAIGAIGEIGGPSVGPPTTPSAPT
jgi:GxxExxY protein